MKEKILSKEFEKSESKETAGVRESTTKREVEVIVSQETICACINNLSGSLSSLGDIDGALLEEDLQAKLEETKTNIINAIHFQSTYLQTQD